MDNGMDDDVPALDLSAELLKYEVEADVLVLPGEVAVVETPLAAADEEALEAGIASMFESLLLSDAVYIEPAEEPMSVEPTFALLDELNRIWAQPLAA